MMCVGCGPECRSEGGWPRTSNARKERIAKVFTPIIINDGGHGSPMSRAPPRAPPRDESAWPCPC